MQVKQHARQVEQDLRVVGRHRERAPKALDGCLRVPLDAPEVSDLIVNLHRLGLLALRLLEPPLDGVDIDLGALLALLLEHVRYLRLRDVEVGGAVLDPDQMVVVGEVDRLTAVQNLTGQRSIKQFFSTGLITILRS